MLDTMGNMLVNIGLERTKPEMMRRTGMPLNILGPVGMIGKRLNYSCTIERGQLDALSGCAESNA